MPNVAWYAGQNLSNLVLGRQRLDSTGACTLFLLLRGVSTDETMSKRLTHDLWIYGLTSLLAVCFNTRGHRLQADFELQRLIQNGAVSVLNSTLSNH